jgi:DNA-binding FrmR family transcriptional regulator
VIGTYKEEATRRLAIAAGHLESVRRMVADERYCVDIMKQLAAVQASLEQVQQVLLRNHLATCVTDAIRAGSGEPLIDELITALKYSKGLGAGPESVGGPGAEPHCSPSPAVPS